MNPMQVFVVEDDDDVRKGLVLLVEAAGFPVQSFASAGAFLDSIVGNCAELYGCLVLDVRMPEVDGLQLQRRIVDGGGKIPIIFLTGQGALPDAVAAMRAGAVDFLLKPVDGSRLLTHIEQLWQHETERLHRRLLQANLLQMAARLTGREQQVLALALDGLPNRSIATSLGLSERTIEAHRSRLLLKLGAPSLQAWLQQCEKSGLARQDMLGMLRVGKFHST